MYEVEDEMGGSMGVKLFKGDTFPVETGIFHNIHTVGNSPSCYMYTYEKKIANTMDEAEEKRQVRSGYSPFPLIEDVQGRLGAFYKMLLHISNGFHRILYKL